MELPKGVTLDAEWRRQGVRNWWRCAFSGDGLWLAAGGGADGGALFDGEGRSKRVELWGNDVAWMGGTGEFVGSIAGGVTAIAPTGAGGRRLAVLNANSLATCGALWAAGGNDGRVIGSFGGLKASGNHVYGAAFSHTGSQLLTANWDRTLQLWDAATRAEVARVDDPHGSGLPYRARWHENAGQWLTSGQDAHLALWSRELNLVRRVHLASNAYGLELHPTLPFAACHGRTELTLLRTDTWDPVAKWTTSKVANYIWPPLAFHPTEPLLVTRGRAPDLLAVLRLDPEVLLGAAHRPQRRYQAAKIVLLGDSGVGKTGLGLVLSGQPYRETTSTHKRLVHPLGRREEREGGAAVTRERVLWDLAGQPGYRLVHHLHLRDVAVALLVVDGSRDSDPLAGARYWARALARAATRDGIDAPPMVLVCARSDRGAVRLSAHALAEQARALGACAVHVTSAATGEGIPALSKAIESVVDWGRVPVVHSDLVYDTVRTLVGTLQSEGALLLPTEAILARYVALPKAPRASAEGVVGCLRALASTGTLRWLDAVGLWLVQPEALDALAHALVLQAAREPDGLGGIAEDRALTANFAIPADIGVPDLATRRTLLRAAVDDLVNAEVVYRVHTDEGVWLVFPTESSRDLDDLPESHDPIGTFRYGGAIPNVFATAVVRLAHSGVLASPQLYRDAAVFSASTGGELAVRLSHRGDGDASLGVFARGMDPGVVAVVEGFLDRHLRLRALLNSVSFRRAVRCPTCGLGVPDRAVERRRERGERDVQCTECDTRFVLPPAEPGVIERPAERSRVDVMAANADAAREQSAAEVRLAARRAEGRYDAFLCYNSKDRAEVVALYDRLTARGIHAWVDFCVIRPGDSEIGAMEAAIDHVQSALVLLGPHGLGLWQDDERKALLRLVKSRGRRVIPVRLPTWTETTPLPVLLADLNAVDLRAEADRFEDPFESLLRVLTEAG